MLSETLQHRVGSTVTRFVKRGSWYKLNILLQQIDYSQSMVQSLTATFIDKSKPQTINRAILLLQGKQHHKSTPVLATRARYVFPTAQKHVKHIQCGLNKALSFCMQFCLVQSCTTKL